jgi:hypothetical protein
MRVGPVTYPQRIRLSGSMIHAVSILGRLAKPPLPTTRWLDWFGRGATAALGALLHLHEVAHLFPKPRMSQEWLDDYARRSHKHADDV